MNIKEYREYIAGKNVGFLGIGRSNMPLIRLVKECGAKVTVRDKKPKGSFGNMEEELNSLGVEMVLDDGYLENLCAHEIIYKTPGIRGDMPEIEEAVGKGSILSSEMELFFDLCPCKIFAITGSDGKTTTTTIVYKILTQAGYTCHLGGNIGRPLIGDIEKIKETDIAVVELSSFQLFNMKKSADIAVVTNLSENHLDWHKDYEEYKDAKKNIFNHQTKEGLLVLNADNADTLSMMDEAKGRLRMFSLKEGTGADVWFSDGAIYSENGKIINRKDIRIVGEHNVANYMAAICAVKDYVKNEDIKAVAESFGGVEHRIEYVRTIDGVSYYNDSIGSSPARTMATLKSFQNPVVLIAGGRDKKLSYEELGKLIKERVKHLVLVGESSEIISKAVEAAGGLPTDYCTSYEEAVRCAKNAAESGDSVLLSPASTSFDMFRDFEERGNTFKDIVKSL